MSGWEAEEEEGRLRCRWAWETMPHIGQPGFGAKAIWNDLVNAAGQSVVVPRRRRCLGLVCRL
jgi:hypothetical protein